MDCCDYGSICRGAQSVCLEGLMSISLKQPCHDCWVMPEDLFAFTSPVSIPISCDTMDNFLGNLYRSEGEGNRCLDQPVTPRRFQRCFYVLV